MHEIDQSLELELIQSIIRAQKLANLELEVYKNDNPCCVLNKHIEREYHNLNFCYPDTLIYPERIELQEPDTDSLGGKSIIGSSLWIAGMPILKKRFVTPGATAGTSIASKYLSRLLPQRMQMRIMGTVVLGRALGRFVPYVGIGLIAIDVIEVLVSLNTDHSEYKKEHKFTGWGGGRSGGGGAGRSF